MFEPIYILVRPLRGTNRRKGETVVGQTRQLNVYNQSSTVASKTSKRDAVIHASTVLCPCQTRYKLHTVYTQSFFPLILLSIPTRSLPSFGLQRKHGPAASRLMAAAGKSTFHHHLAQVSASSSPSVYPPTYWISPCLSRTLSSSPRPPRSSYHSKSPNPIQSNQSSDIPRCSTHYSPTSQAHGQPARSLYHCASAPAQRDRQQAADQARPRPPAKPTQRSPPVHRRQPNS
jgi:hypothetical protein